MNTLISQMIFPIHKLKISLNSHHRLIPYTTTCTATFPPVMRWLNGSCLHAVPTCIVWCCHLSIIHVTNTWADFVLNIWNENSVIDVYWDFVPYMVQSPSRHLSLIPPWKHPRKQCSSTLHENSVFKQWRNKCKYKCCSFPDTLYKAVKVY
jgi:hypothetical protein